MKRSAIRVLQAAAFSVVILFTAYCGIFRWESASRKGACYEVYSSFLKTNIEKDAHEILDGNGVILIFDHTSNSGNTFLVPRNRDNYPRVVLYDMALRNLFPRRLERDFRLRNDYKLTPSDDLTTIFQLEPKAVSGIIFLSQVSFSGDGTSAYFYMEHHCPLCGGAAFITMKKVGGQWIVANEDATWVS